MAKKDYTALMNDADADLDKLTAELKQEIYSGKTEELEPEETEYLTDEEAKAKADEEAKAETKPEAEVKGEKPVEEDKTKTTEEAKPSETKEEKTVEEKKVETPVKKETTLRIDDSYIKSRPTEEQAILQGIKGEVVSQKVLKNYLESQKLIASLKSQSPRPIERPPQPKLTPEVAEQQELIKRQLILDALKSRYRNIPSDPVEFEKYLVELNYEHPLEAKALIDDFYNTKKTVETDIETYNNLSQNWESILEQTVVDDVKAFEDKLATYGLTSQDLGLDLNFDQNKYNKYMFDEIFYAGKDVLDNRVVQKINDNIVYAPKGAVFQKLLDKNMDKIVEMAKTKAQSSPQIPAPPKLQPKVEPSVGSSRTGGYIPTPNTEDLESMDDIEKALQRAKKDIFTNK